MSQSKVSIVDIQNRIVREFSLLEDWTERYKYIIKFGSKLPHLDSSKKVENNIVKGCQSQVWLHAEFSDGKIIFEADSDAAITKGLVALMVHLYSHQTPSAILSTEPTFITEIGMHEHLSPTRANGLASMVKQMKIYALAFSS
ncbi:MAG: Fe-S metabolism protein SufE [Balneola sp.]|nr:Fe-S metabolism protein SufE [Balneola sp.]|tara:strand:- start:13235 stop:13663 length:429 start_codon:yes stop_codon:yes gene_type:complete